MIQLFSDEHDFLMQIVDLVFSDVDPASTLSHLSPARRVFATVIIAQEVIDNGGLQFFFESDFPGKPPYQEFSDAYRKIGAIAVADAIDRAVDLFGFSDPHLKRDERNRCLSEHHGDEDWEFWNLDHQVSDPTTSFRVDAQLAKFVRNHPDEFNLD